MNFEQDVLRNNFETKETLVNVSVSKDADPQEPIITNELDELMPAPLPPLPGPPLPIYKTGGGKVRKSLPCENGRSDCNDHNPCSIDTCENDVCIHTLDTSKDQFGSCETDGHSCTIGKCIESDDQIQCFEQSREFISGELGCMDDEQCTADSCIEFPLNRGQKTEENGTVIPNNRYECVQEITSGILCAADGCLSGFCQQSGTGMDPQNPFVVECVANAEAPANCPATGNPCTVNVCDAVEGCIEENLPAETSCDARKCVINGLCDGLGACLGTPVDPEIACGASPATCLSYACDNELGCVLNQPANEGLACSNGDPCVINETCAQGLCANGSAFICPDDNNVCTTNTCKAGSGCIYPPSPVVACDDGNNCTNNDTCNNGACQGELLECAITDTPCQIGFCDPTVAEGCSTANLNGPYGDQCSTPYLGICSIGALMCLDGELTGNCEPLVRPGDQIEYCNSQADVNCDGQINVCNCPEPPLLSIDRYVDVAGSDTTPSGPNDCTDANAPCQTIAHAVSVALSYDTLNIGGGLFSADNVIINKYLYIFGRGQDLSVISPLGANRIFNVDTSITAYFCGLTITGGNTTENGGGILVSSDSGAVINSSTVSNNTSSSGGGGVHSEGALFVTDSIFSGNVADSLGGGIFSSGSLFLTNSTFTENRTLFDGGAGIYNGNNATVESCNFSNNISAAGGGGILNVGTMDIYTSTIDNNTASDGGGIFNFGAGTATIENSTINSNSVINVGGGVFNSSRTFISNSTISGNTAGTSGGGFYNSLNSAVATISTCTITQNSSPTGAVARVNNGSVTISTSIVANQISGADCSGIIINGGSNLDKDSSCSGFFHVPTFSLPALADNGGLTKTHALQLLARVLKPLMLAALVIAVQAINVVQ